MKFLTPKQIADILQIDIMTVYREIKRRKLKAGKFGKEFRTSSADFEEYLHNAYQAAEQSARSQHSCIAPARSKTVKTGKMAQQMASKKAVQTKTKANRAKTSNNVVKKKVVKRSTKPTKRSK